MEEAMSLLEAAAYAGVTPDALRGAIRRGRLRATKRGRDWEVRRHALDAYIVEAPNGWLRRRVSDAPMRVAQLAATELTRRGLAEV
jgi:excisionase family DNA binding protein